MDEYNCKPLNIERLRQSARMTRQNQLDGLPDSAWQAGIQEWAADRLTRAEELLQGVEDCIDHMDDRNFGGDVMEESMRWVEKYREEVKTFLSGND